MNIEDTKPIYLKENLEILLPSMFQILEGQDISWSDIHKNFLRNYQKRKKEFEKNNNHLTLKKDEHHFYDILHRVLEHDLTSTTYLVYFESVFKQLNENTSPKEKVLISKTIRNILKDLSINYTHFLGELFVLNELLRSKLFRLEGIEFLLPNGKNIDFHLVTTEDNKPDLLEVMNIRITDKTPKDYNELKLFLESKIQNKISDKTEGLTIKFTPIISPVLWGDPENLKPISDFFKNGNGLNFERVLEPYSLGIWSNKEDKIVPRFGSISKFFDPLPV